MNYKQNNAVICVYIAKHEKEDIKPIQSIYYHQTTPKKITRQNTKKY